MPVASSTAEPAGDPDGAWVAGNQPTADELRALGASLFADDLVVFPVRHHSPACALQLARLLAATPPSLLLIEGPRSFDPLVPLLAHAEAEAPLAVYTWAVARATAERPEQRYAAYYPFCDYSPELVAVRAGHRLGVSVRFVDLDFAEQCRLALADEAAPGQEIEPDATSLLDERHLARSQHLHLLAKRLGCRDHEELWEHLFEIPAPALAATAHVARVAAYCRLARLDSTPAELAADGTLAREAEMASHLAAARRDWQPGSGPVVAVLGGFHAVVMPELLAARAAAGPAARAPARPSLGPLEPAAPALIRYSFDRLDRLNGYAAGMTSPAWHQQLWERQLASDRLPTDRPPAGRPGDDAGELRATRGVRVRRDAALAMLSDLAEELRSKHQLPLPVPTLVAAYHQALGLAALRQRAAPAREDVLDAILSCFVKGDADGDGVLVRAAARRAFTGQAVGRVPPGASTPPLVRDFAVRARRQRLKVDDSEPRHATLDLYRRPEHRVTSRLLHGMVLLSVPFAVRTAGPDFVAGRGLERLQEQWEYVYSPITEGSLVEAAVYGVTVPQAVANRFVAQLDRQVAEGLGRDARAAAATLAQGCVLGLHDHLPRLLATLRQAIGADADFAAVAAATASIGLLWESREPLEARDIDELPGLLGTAYERAIYLGGELPAGADTDATPWVTALTGLRELLTSTAGRPLDASLYWALVTAIEQRHPSPLLRGATAGLLYAAGRLAADDLERALAGHLTGLAQPRDAVAYLRGLLLTAREAAWQQPALLTVLDRLLATWDDEAFVACLPELRLAFAEMTPKETDRIAEAVATLHGGSTLGPLVLHQVSAAEVQAHLAVSAAVRTVLAADGLAGWLATAAEGPA
jgi:hypothetical protein